MIQNFRNRVQEILFEKGFSDVKPSDKILEELGPNMTLHRFGKICRNSTQPDLQEAYNIAAWLQVPISDLCRVGDIADPNQVKIQFEATNGNSPQP